MSNRAEEAALKAYPYYLMPNRSGFDGNEMLRIAYKKGYEQAEKDLGWISVKDILPDSDGWYFTCNENHGVMCSIGVSYFNDEIWQNQDEDFNLIESNIDYWMPIPKLPNKE